LAAPSRARQVPDDMKGVRGHARRVPGVWFPQSTLPEIDLTTPRADGGVPGAGGTSVSVESSVAPVAELKLVMPIPLNSRDSSASGGRPTLGAR
jgi:hypothetical protein